jgi:sec-independent protein translocase protein TatA
MPQLGPLEILVVVVVALLVFGPHRLPEIGRQVGGALREIRRFQHDVRGHIDGLMTDDASDAAAPAPTLPARSPEPPTLDGAPHARSAPQPAPSRFLAPAPSDADEPLAAPPGPPRPASPTAPMTGSSGQPAPSRYLPPAGPPRAT